MNSKSAHPLCWRHGVELDEVNKRGEIKPVGGTATFCRGRSARGSWWTQKARCHYVEDGRCFRINRTGKYSHKLMFW